MKKSRVAMLSVIVLMASASAAVNIRDPVNVFGNIDMQNEFKITNLADPNNPQDAATKNYVDNNAGSGGNEGLNWDSAYDVAEMNDGGNPTASVSCEQGETLVSATCSISTGFAADFEAQRMEPNKCDQRTTTSASISTNEPAAAVEGTCVPGSSSSTDGGSDDTSSSQGIGQVDVIEEDGTLGPYKYCSISRSTNFDEDDGRESCTVSRDSDGVWSMSSSGGDCHAACFGLDTQTETITVNARGQSGGNVQTVPLGRDYPNVIKAEWMGPGIQPARTEDDEIPPPEDRHRFGRATEWRISVLDSQSDQRHTIVRTGSIRNGRVTLPVFFGDDDRTGRVQSDSEPVLNVFRSPDTYEERFSQVTVDSVKLNAGGYPNKELFTVPENTETIKWEGSEELKITYIPEE